MNKKEAVAGVIARHGEEILDNASNPGKLVKAIGKAGKDLDRTLHPQGIPVSMGGAVFYCGDGCKITNDMWKVLEDIILWWYDDTTPPSNIGEDRQSDRKVMLRRMEQYGDELDWLFDTYLAGGEYAEDFLQSIGADDRIEVGFYEKNGDACPCSLEDVERIRVLLNHLLGGDVLRECRMEDIREGQAE